MLAPADGLAILGVCGVVIAGIIKVPKITTSRNDKSKPCVGEDRCKERREVIFHSMDDLKEDINEIKADVKTLLNRR